MEAEHRTAGSFTSVAVSGLSGFRNASRLIQSPDCQVSAEKPGSCDCSVGETRPWLLERRSARMISTKQHVSGSWNSKCCSNHLFINLKERLKFIVFPSDFVGPWALRVLHSVTDLFSDLSRTSDVALFLSLPHYFAMCGCTYGSVRSYILHARGIVSMHIGTPSRPEHWFLGVLETLQLLRHGLATPLLLTLEVFEFVHKTNAAKKLCCCRMAHLATKGCASNTKCCCDSATIAKVSSVCGDTSKDVDTSGFTLDPWMPTGLWWRMASLSLSAATAQESQTQSCGSTSKFNNGAGRWEHASSSQRLGISSQCCEEDAISIHILFEDKTL